MTACDMSPDPLWTREFLGFSCALVPDTRWLMDKAGGKRKIHVMARMQGGDFEAYCRFSFFQETRLLLNW